MELKLGMITASPTACSSSNCTFMELKLWKIYNRLGWTASSNCTFMELKCAIDLLNCVCHKVLIVPLWNWNFCAYRSCCCPPGVLIVPLWNWNRDTRLHPRDEKHVLIVPLWNWNAEPRAILSTLRGSNCTFMELKFQKMNEQTIEREVLIVPLWNWNKLGVTRCVPPIYSSNYTFMELKFVHDTLQSLKLGVF